MAYVCVEVSCSPNGDTRYPVPTTLKIVRIFASAEEATHEFPEDQAFKAESEFTGQDVYYLLWKTDEALNLDRNVVADNTISNVGGWLPDSDRMYTDVSDLAVELIPPARIKARAKERERAQKAAGIKHKKTAGGDGPTDSNASEGFCNTRIGSGVRNGRGGGVSAWRQCL